MKNRVTAPTWAEINLDNINFNLNNIRKLLKEIFYSLMLVRAI